MNDQVVIDPESLDLTNLREITGGDTETEEALFEAFIVCGEENIAHLEQLCRDGPQTDWKEEAHALKGQAANLGAVRLAAFAHEAQMAYEASATEKQRILASIEEEWGVVSGYIEQLRA